MGRKTVDIENNILDEPSSRLEKPVPLSDLIDKCSDFTIRSMDEDEIERSEEMDVTKVYSFEELEPYLLTENLEPASDDDDDAPTYDDISKSFPYFRKKMNKVTEDGKVMKLIDRESIGEKVPSEGIIVVYVHYAAYVELVENPFDCTRLRHKKPESKTLGVGDVIPGLEIAIRSMRRGEKAKFLIHPDLAFREKGIPPRIPPQATILFDIELIDICEETMDEELKALDKTFEKSFEIATKLRRRGNKLKTLEKNLDSAISTYRKGLKVLIEARFDNDIDDKRRKVEMLHFYTNLAVCFLEKKRFRQVCSTFNDAQQDCSPLAEKNVKLLYLSSKALRNLGSFDEALKRLRTAIRLKPADESILKEMETLNVARKNYHDNERRSCKQMFGFMNPDDVQRRDDDDEILRTVSSEFKEDILQTFECFKSSNKKSETLNAAGFTYAEKKFIRKTCVEENLVFKTPRDNTIVIIKKTI